MLLNGGTAGGGGAAASTARSGLRPLSGGGGSGGNDENSVSEGLRNKKLGVGGNNGGGGGIANKLALGSKSLSLDDSGSMNTGSKTPGPSQARRRAFGDISNRKAAKSVSFQNTKTPGRGAKSTKKHSSVSQQQRTPFAVRNGNSTNNNSTRKKTPYATGSRSVSFGGPSSAAKKPGAVLPMDRLSSTTSAVAATKDPSLDVSDDDISDVELPAGGGVWDPMDFFDDERNGRDRSGSFEFYRGVNDDIKAYHANVRERNQREFEKAVEEAEDRAKRDAERIAQEDYDFVMQGMDSLLNDLDDDANIDLSNDPMLHPPGGSETYRRPFDDDFAI